MSENLATERFPQTQMAAPIRFSAQLKMIPGQASELLCDFLTTSWIEFAQFDPAPGCLGWNQAMKELGVIATLIALGFGTSNSVAYVFNQSCRMLEAYREEVANQSAIAASAMHKEPIGMQITCSSLPALE